MNFSMIQVEVSGSVCRIRLNRPEKRNALCPQLVEELREAFQAANRDLNTAVVILSGAGPAFCAGLDLAHLQALEYKSRTEHYADSAAIAALFVALRNCDKPTIAAVDGAAIAGGCGLATLCDFTLATPRAKFGYTEVRIGFIPAIVSGFLRAQLGEKQARDLLLSGRILEAEEAYRLGLVNRIVEVEKLTSAAETLAVELLKNSPTAIAATKRLLRCQTSATERIHMELAVQANAEARATADFREGIRSFLEKRSPVWPSLQGES